MSEKKKGRPTLYKEEYCDAIIEFFNKPLFEYVEIEVTDDDGNAIKTIATNKFGDPIRVPSPLPTKERFAFEIGVHRDTIHEWSRVHEDFSDAIKKAEDLQKDILIQNGLVNAYDKTFAIFVAKNVTDMNDRQNIDHTSSDGSMTPKGFNDFYSDETDS